jgi:DNA-binding NarL/FixJ family response regulator
MSIKIALYEDNKTYRESLSMYLSMNPKFEVVGSFKNANNIENELKEFEPEVILMDIDMPGINGIHAVKKIRSYNTKTHVIMLTVFETNELIFDALCAGANGYLLKNTAPEKIADAILEVYVGGAPMTTSIARKVLLYFSNRNVQTDFSLTQREKEILNLLVKGYTYKMIASECIISMDTVRSHIKKIYEKLQVNSNIEAVKKAMDHKII